MKGHNGDLGNEKSDELAKEGATKDVPDDLPLDIPPEYDLQGAKLATITQAIAYKGIRAQNEPPTRQTAIRNLNISRSAIRDFTHLLETDSISKMEMTCHDLSLLGMAGTR